MMPRELSPASAEAVCFLSADRTWVRLIVTSKIAFNLFSGNALQGCEGLCLNRQCLHIFNKNIEYIFDKKHDQRWHFNKERILRIVFIEKMSQLKWKIPYINVCECVCVCRFLFFSLHSYLSHLQHIITSNNAHESLSLLPGRVFL